MKAEHEVALVTNDRWMKEGGQLDAADRELLREVSQDGKFKVQVMNIREMFETMKNTEPEKFEKLRQHMAKQYGHPIKSMEEFESLCAAADKRSHEFDEVTKTMTLTEACQIRVWRVMDRMTWRSVARAAYQEGFLQHRWDPPSNQLMGIALTERAAHFFGEKGMEPPWN
jgi:hypothetical protein